MLQGVDEEVALPHRSPATIHEQVRATRDVVHHGGAVTFDKFTQLLSNRVTHDVEIPRRFAYRDPCTTSATTPLMFTFRPGESGTAFYGWTSTVRPSAAVATHGTAVRFRSPHTDGLAGF